MAFPQEGQACDSTQPTYLHEAPGGVVPEGSSGSIMQMRSWIPPGVLLSRAFFSLALCLALLLLNHI